TEKPAQKAPPTTPKGVDQQEAEAQKKAADEKQKREEPEKTPVVLVIARVFLRLIKSIIAPLIFATLVAGIAGAGSVKAMGRIGLKAILYFEVATTIALFVGLGAVNIVQHGVGVKLDVATRARL